MRFDWIETLAHLPPVLDALLKLTLVLTLAWLCRPLLRHANPRWRVFFWRGVALSAALMPAAVLLAPQIRVPLLPAPASEPDVLPSGSESLLVPHRPEDPGRRQHGLMDPAETELHIVPAMEPAAAATAAPRVSLRTWLPAHLASVLFTAWLVPVLGLAAGAVIARRRTGRVLRTARSAPPAACHLLEMIARDFGYGRSIRLYASGDVQSPCVAGILRPVIVVPQRMFAGGDTDLRGILAHEVAHLKSRDLPWSWLIQVLSICLWFHPLVWGVRREHLDACEQVSDAEAARYVGDATAYLGTLARAALGVLRRRYAPAGIPMVRKPSIHVRLEMLRQKIDASPLRRRRVAWVSTAGCLLLVGLGGLRLVDARTAEDGREPAAAAEQPAAGQLAAGQLAAGQLATAEEPKTMVIGQVLDPAGKPVPLAEVAVIARSRQPHRGGDLGQSGPKSIGTGKTDDRGRFQVTVPQIVPAKFRSADIVAAKSGYGAGWEPLAVHPQEHRVVIRLAEEQIVRGRVVDDRDRPAAGARIRVTWLGRIRLGEQEGVGPYFGRRRLGETQFPAWPEPAITDDQGQFVIRGVSRRHTISLRVSDDRFAPWTFRIKPPGEKPPKRDAKYEQRGRYLGKGGADVYCENASQELTLSPPPSQIFQGQVVYEDTGKPAAHARLTVYARQLKFGSMIGVPGLADADGRFRINPYPGKFFDVKAYPPNGQPYLILEKTVTWPEEAASHKVDLALPRGVLVRGKIKEQPSGHPVAGAAVQYYPRAKNPHVPGDVVTRWQGTVVSGANGLFRIALPAGKGTLLVHGPTPDYVQEIIGSRQLHDGRPGGVRQYVHASIPLDLEPGAATHEVTASLQRGVTVRGRLVGPPGRAVADVLMLTHLFRPPDPDYRAHPVKVREGRFELPGCHPEKTTTVYFLDPKNELGAVVEVSGEMAGHRPLEVRLAPCGTATAKFVDPDGKPMVDHRLTLKIVMTPGIGAFRPPTNLEDGQWLADEDFVANFDRLHYWDGPNTDQQGRCRFPALIPGATYRLNVFDKATSKWVTEDFSVKSGETLQLSEMVVKLNY